MTSYNLITLIYLCTAGLCSMMYKRNEYFQITRYDLDAFPLCSVFLAFWTVRKLGFVKPER